MDKNDWHKIKQLFHQASELPLTEQESFVRAQCDGEVDEHVYTQVMSLLNQTEQTVQLGNPVAQVAHSLLGNDDSLIGQRMGSYRLIKPLGYGGMGTVFLAERADEQFNQQVAIKVIRSSALSEHVKRDFFTERQILANLEHAYISRLLDGGTTNEGLPYLVMEYIEGVPINEYCNAQQLSLRQRLVLFCKVCSAVQYAHQKLIVHCDLKPSNILITANGEPRLLDFGISKLLTKSEITPSAQHTNSSERRLTLQYSSPELIRGESITTLSDVYSLGVILYELLCGERPYNLSESETQTIQQLILETTIKPPSRRLVPQSKTSPRQLPLDLDNITLMALQKEPRQRYESVAQLSNDINKYLTHFPVLATPPNWLYRSQKFLQRNRVASVLSSVLLFAVVGSGLAIWQQSKRVAYERDLAIHNSERANAISNFLSNMFVEMDPYKGNGQDVKVKDVLAQASKQLNTNDEHALTSQPLVAAALHQVIGKVYNEIGMLDLAETHLTRAVQIYRENHATNSEDYLGALFILSILYDYRYDYEKNLPVMVEAYELSKKLFGEDHRDTLGALDNLGMFYMNMGNLEKAQTILEHVYQRRKTLFGEFHRHTLYSIEQLGKLNLLQGNYAKSERYYRTCLTKRTEIYGEKHPYTLSCLSRLGLNLLTQRKFNQAQPFVEQHIKLASRVLGPTHPDVLGSKHNLADIYLGLGNLPQAETLFKEVLDLRRNALGKDHIETLQTQMKLARVFRLQHRYTQATALLAEALEKQTQALGFENRVTLNTAQEQALLLLDTHQYQQALTLANKIRDVQIKMLGETHPDLTETITLLSNIRRAQSQSSPSSQLANEQNIITIGSN
ncbi:tetratricopeptide repeat protein [Neptunicella sp.]|uniref:tetratricopeptide repeat protein n=1 Tax=Neptunicella sp. TaxID=2125986 RepID=UPI003F694BDA